MLKAIAAFSVLWVCTMAVAVVMLYSGGTEVAGTPKAAPTNAKSAAPPCVRDAADAQTCLAFNVSR
jgi:hypothetical protein